jgi:hypothetical protein
MIAGDKKAKAAAFPIGAAQGMVTVPAADKEGNFPAESANEGKKISGTWYQPKDAKTYTIPRYVAGDKVSSKTTPFEPAAEGDEVKWTDCMKGVSLSGAVTLAAASLTAATIALF